jgi:single-strand DNA-binding protein
MGNGGSVMNLNKVLVAGRLTRDPDPLRYTPNGTAIADISIAINRVTKNHDGSKSESVTYVDVTLWSRQAEVAEEYLKKGAQVLIEGHLQLGTWDDKQTGQKRSRLRVVAESMQMLGGAPEKSRQQNRPPAAPKTAPPPVKQAAPATESRDDTPF